MTSTARKIFRPGRGYTLLEIVICLVIVVMIFGGAMGLLTFSSDANALKKASRELEGMAKRARITAVLRQTPYALVFRQGQVDLMPWAETVEGNGDQEDAPAQEADDSSDPKPKGAVHWSLSLDNGMQAEVLRWNQTQWQSVTGDAVQIWRFDPTGLCEPLKVRLDLHQSWMEMSFHPLTAAISESHLEVK